MDLKTCLVVFTLVLRFSEVMLETDERQPYFINTRGFGKRSLEYEEEDAPNKTVKRGIFWNISKMMKHFEQFRNIDKGPIQTDMKNPANSYSYLVKI